MMEKQNCYLTNLFLTGSTTSGLTKDSRAPRSPAIILFGFSCQKKGKDVLLLAPKSMSTSTGNCSSGGAKATWRRQVTKRRSKANLVTLLSEKRSLSKMTPEVNLGKPSIKKSAVLLNIVQKAFDPPPLFEHLSYFAGGVF